MMKVVLLAAGLSTRMGGKNKLICPIGDTCLVEIAMRNALSYTDDVLVVTGHESQAICEKARRLGIRTLYNGSYANGQETSIRSALEMVDGPLMILPADMPFITRDVYDECGRHLCGHDAARPVSAGRPGHPVALSKTAVEAYRSGNGMMRDLVMRMDHDFYEASTNAVITDVDTPQDFQMISAMIRG